MDRVSIGQLVAGLELGAALVRDRSNLHLPLPLSAVKGEVFPLDVVVFELCTWRLISDLRKLRRTRISRKKLSRSEMLARQSCTAVLVCRDLFLEEGMREQAKRLVSSYKAISELEISTETLLNHEQLEKWLNYSYHDAWPLSEARN